MRRLLGLIAVVGLLLVGCTSGNKDANQQREESIAARAQVFAQASDVAPLPHPQNFPLRKALVEYTNRQDLVNHPWYIYLLGQQGNYIGYFVGKTYPISTCDFLSSTENITSHDSPGWALVTQSPSLDGIFYGGSGASGGCDYFFFDAATNAMQVISHNMIFFVSDAPLRLDVQPIKVAQ